MATNGSAGASGTISDPLDTLANALNQALPGDKILMRGGNHQAGDIWYTKQGGQAGAFLTIDRYQNENVIITGTRLVIESQYIRIQNLKFQNFKIIVRHQEGIRPRLVQGQEWEMDIHIR